MKMTEIERSEVPDELPCNDGDILVLHSKF